MSFLNKIQNNQFHSFNKMIKTKRMSNDILDINKCNKNICLIDENDNIFIKNRKTIINKNNETLLSIYRVLILEIVFLVVLLIILFFNIQVNDIIIYIKNNIKNYTDINSYKLNYSIFNLTGTKYEI
jgi:hypothetical protein